MRWNLPFSGWRLLGIVFAMGAVWPLSEVTAYELVIHPSIVGQVRVNSLEEQEIPLNGYLGFSGAFKPWEVGLEDNLRVFQEASGGLDDFDLYQSVVHLKPTSALRLDFGRQFVNQGFTATTLDGLQMTFTPKGPFDFVIYSGIPRNVEIGDFNRDDGATAGFALGWKVGPQTQIRLQSAWRRFVFDHLDWQKNDQVSGGFDFFHQFGGKSRPLFYALAEYSLTGNILETGTAGLDIYPTDALALNFEFNYFDIDRERDAPTILSLFTTGETLAGRFAATALIIPDFLDFMASYAFQRIEIGEDVARNGHLVDATFMFYDDDIGITLAPGLFFQNTFGGNVGGVKLLIHEQFTKRFYASLSANYGSYRKVTGNDDFAVALSGWVGLEVAKGLTLAAGSEYNRNNLYATDVRGSFKVDYLFQHKK